jgi:cell division protein FtsL
MSEGRTRAPMKGRPLAAGKAGRRDTGRTAGRGSTRRSRLRVVAPRPRGRKRRLPFLVISFVLVGALVFGVVSLQAVISQSAFRMQRLEQRSTQLRQSYGDLKLQVAELSSPERIVHEAQRLGMQLPDPSKLQTLAVAGIPRDTTVTRAGGSPSFALKRQLGDAP